jgi:excinuclease UvrABC helicase subunit UvrB
MTEEEKNQAAAYIKLHEDVKQLIRDSLVEILRKYDTDVVMGIQNATLGTPSFDIRVKQVITAQMQR